MNRESLSRLMKNASQLTIKGTKNGLVINLPDDGELSALLLQLETRLQATASFFKGGRVALQVGRRELSREDIEQIGSLLDAQGVSLWSVFGQSEATREAAQSWGLETEPSETRGKVSVLGGGAGSVVALSAQHQLGGPSTSGILIRKTLRSGQRIEHQGDVTLIGDVNPGAEIIAGGSVVVWGKLRGTVHAGASGDDSAVVCALSLFPTQLRIGNHIARSPETQPPRVKTPEMASVQHGEIIAEPWHIG